MGEEKEEPWLHYTDDLGAAEAHTSNAGCGINGNSLDFSEVMCQLADFLAMRTFPDSNSQEEN